MSGLRVLFLLLAASLSFPTFGAVVYDESVNGAFSSSRLSPTLITLSEGSNVILGTQGSDASAVLDYVTFAVPTGLTLSSITLLDTNIGDVGFIAMQAGSRFTRPPTIFDAVGILGWWHYTPLDINVDILPLMGIPADGSTGFTPPLPADNYTLWIQDFSAGLFSYGFDLQLTAEQSAVPEPATWLTSLAALVGVALFDSRRRLWR